MNASEQTHSVLRHAKRRTVPDGLLKPSTSIFVLGKRETEIPQRDVVTEPPRTELTTFQWFAVVLQEEAACGNSRVGNSTMSDGYRHGVTACRQLRSRLLLLDDLVTTLRRGVSCSSEQSWKREQVSLKEKDKLSLLAINMALLDRDLAEPLKPSGSSAFGAPGICARSSRSAAVFVYEL